MINTKSGFWKRVKFEWASQGVPLHHLLPPSVAKSLDTFTYRQKSVAIAMRISRISYKHDK